MAFETKTLLLTLATVSAAACCHIKTDNTQSAATEETTDTCAFKIDKAYAWVNRMPQPVIKDAKTQAKNRMLHVKADLLPEATSAHLERNTELTTEDNLVLNITAPDTSEKAQTGTTYSESMTRPSFKTISIMCNGLEVSKIKKIAKTH